MKASKLLLSAVLAALGLSHVASAQTAIYLSGAPATRKIWNIALYDTIVAASGGTNGIYKYYTGSSYNSANQIAIVGGKIGGTAVTIYGSWTGSTGGNQSVANTPPNTIAALEVGFIASNLVNGTGGSLATSATNGNPQFPNINLSDTQQSTVPFNGHVTKTSPATNYVGLTEATPTSPAITAYAFVANASAPSRLNNLTTNLAQQLFTDGEVPLAFFSGSNSDESTIVYAVGRDIASGARYALLAETGIGTGNSDSLSQFEPTISGTTLTDIVDNPATSGTINLIAPIAGNGGYPSFTPVDAVLSATSTATVGYAISYVTDTDAVTAQAAGAHILSWNGVSSGIAASGTAVYTNYEGAKNTAPVSIAEGAYTYWTYLHVYFNNSNISAIAKTLANSLSSDLSTDTATGAILTSDVGVGRNYDGGTVTQNY